MIPCGNCGTDSFTNKRSWVEEGQLVEMCDKCGVFTAATVPDVFFKGTYTSQALGVEFTSKSQKAAYLKAHDLREAGDEKMSTKSWVDGSREYRKKKFDRDDRPKLRETIRDWRRRAGC